MTPRSEPSTNDLSAFADAIIDLAHKLDTRHPDLRDIVPLTGTEIAVIREIHRSPGATPSHIAEATGLRRSNVSTAIRTLEVGGLVTRDQQAGNARSVTLMPTERANESMARIHAYWATLLKDVPAELLHKAVEATPAVAGIASSIPGR